MNSNVIEIVTILVQKMLHNEDLAANEEEIIQGLLDLGYNLRDIQIAFELIFSSAEIIGVSETYENRNYLPTSERVLSERERLVFREEARNILFSLLKSRLLTMAELEEIIQRGVASAVIEIGIPEIWTLLKVAVKDQQRLTLIKNRYPELKEIQDNQNYWIH